MINRGLLVRIQPSSASCGVKVTACITRRGGENAGLATRLKLSQILRRLSAVTRGAVREGQGRARLARGASEPKNSSSTNYPLSGGSEIQRQLDRVKAGRETQGWRLRSSGLMPRRPGGRRF